MLEEVSMAKEALQQELELTKNSLATVEAAQADAEALAQSTQQELASEKDRSLKLEVELSELRGKLQNMQELEVECRKYKQMLADRDRKSSGGIWGYISGA
jgi:phage-related minor tail protein